MGDVGQFTLAPCSSPKMNKWLYVGRFINPVFFVHLLKNTQQLRFTSQEKGKSPITVGGAVVASPQALLGPGDNLHLHWSMVVEVHIGQ
jgi:hypothetical protein